jgi:hypothetical protein
MLADSGNDLQGELASAIESQGFRGPQARLGVIESKRLRLRWVRIFLNLNLSLDLNLERPHG